LTTGVDKADRAGL